MQPFTQQVAGEDDVWVADYADYVGVAVGDGMGIHV